MAIATLFDENLITRIRKDLSELFYFVKLCFSYHLSLSSVNSIIDSTNNTVTPLSTLC